MRDTWEAGYESGSDEEEDEVAEESSTVQAIDIGTDGEDESAAETDPSSGFSADYRSNSGSPLACDSASQPKHRLVVKALAAPPEIDSTGDELDSSQRSDSVVSPNTERRMLEEEFHALGDDKIEPTDKTAATEATGGK